MGCILLHAIVAGGLAGGIVAAVIVRMAQKK
jgi:hypothetical protein